LPKNPTDTPDPILPYTAGFDLKVGDTVYLNYSNGGTWSTPSQMPPAGTVIPAPGSTSPAGPFPVRAPADITYGIRQSSSAAIGYGWSANATRGALNSDALLSPAAGNPPVVCAPPLVVCAPPLVEDAASPLSAPVVMKGMFFSSGSLSIRLRPANAADTVLYTLNSAEPTGQSAVADPAKPVTINSGAVLRVKSVRTGMLPSPTVTYTFIHPPTVTTQRNPVVEGQPLCDPIIAGMFADSAGPLAGYASAGGIAAQLMARPALAVSFANGVPDPDPPDTPEGSPISVEFIDPANPAAYSQENALIRRSGNHSTGLSSKHSWHLLFKKSATLKGNDRWQPPTVTSGTTVTSVLFPPVPGEKANPVTTFSRLQVRGGSSDGYSADFGRNDSEVTYLGDWWLRENQRAEGGWTPRCRPVSLFINGFYWGVYNMGERPDSECVSDWLCSQPGLTQTEKDARAPGNIQFLRYDGLEPSTVSNADAGNSWREVISAAKACYQAPTNGAAYATLSSKLDVREYIDYMITLHLTGKSDHHNDQFAGWRHPVDSKWHLLQWDGDDCHFMPDNLLYRTIDTVFSNRHPEYLYPEDHTTILGDALENDDKTVLMDTLPHAYLKFVTAYRTAFDQRLRELLLPPSGTTPPPGAGALTQSNINTRFDRLATDIRRTLEAEMMRWGHHTWAELDLHSPDADPAPLRTAWAAKITEIRLLGPSGGTLTDTRLQLARLNLKTAARWSRLLNDIPPPVITWNPATGKITATRGGNTGAVFLSPRETYFADPLDDYPQPTYSGFENAAVNYTVTGNQKYFSARVYAPGLDGPPEWSAIFYYQIP
jgi:hypothetical protein